MYFYVNYGNLIDVFLPIFGKYETFFIKEKDIKNSSDFDFDKKIKVKIIYVGNILDI